MKSHFFLSFRDKYAFFEGEFGTRVLAFGFLFDFTGNGDNSVVHTVEDEILERWFTEALTSHTPDIIVSHYYHVLYYIYISYLAYTNNYTIDIALLLN